MNNENAKKEVKFNKKETVKFLKILGVSTAIVGGVYILGGARGIDIGRRQGRYRGFLEGYAKATADIAYIVKESKEKTE